MNPEDFKINMRLEIGVVIGRKKEYLPVRIEEVAIKYMSISVPMWQGTVIPLHDGQQVTLRIFHRFSYYGFDTVIVGHKLEPIPMLVVERPKTIQSLGQMRENVRIPVALPMRFRKLNDDNNNFSPNKAFTSNISAGGVLICTDVELKEGDEIWLELIINEDEVVSCRASVTRVATVAGAKPSGRVGVHYENMGRKERDILARYIFSKQREFIQRGLTEI